MADFFDRFVGTGTLNLHTADSGDTWDSDSSGVTLSGGAAFGSTSTPANNRMPFSSNIPPVDCSMAIVLGADWIVNRGAYGVILRGSGASGAKSYYTAIFGDAVGPAGGFGFSIYRMISGDSGTQVGTSQAFPSGPIANVQFRFSASGSGASVTLTVYQNGTQIYQVTDANAARITTAGFAGLFSGAADTIAAPDNVRAVWAGALAGPTTTITPSAPTVTVGGTQGFTAAVVETNETINWTCSAGSCSPTTGATTTWTAPGSGTSATVTWTSADLPDRTATATVTLSSGAAATAFTLTGPSSGYKLNVSTAFTFTPSGGPYTGTITPTMTGLAGTWAPTSLSWSASSTAKTATFTPSATGAGNANGTASPTLTAPANVAYTSNPQTLAVTPGALPTSSVTPETFTGGGTFWLTSAPTFTASGVAGVSCGAVTVDSNTQAHANITTGAATGTVTWSDSTTGATVTELVAAIANVLSIGEGFATGLSTVGYAVYDTAGVSVTAWTSVGVTERGSSSGDYGAVVPIPQDGADYEIRWSQGSGTTPPFVHDVRRSAAASSGTGVTVAANGLDAVVVESGINLRQATALALAALAGKASGLGTNAPVFKGAGTNTTRIAATTDANGNRPTVTLTPPA